MDINGAEHEMRFKDENESLRKQIQELLEIEKPLIETGRGLQAENDKLRKALKKYGRHSKECESLGQIFSDAPRKCTCGLEQALEDNE